MNESESNADSTQGASSLHEVARPPSDVCPICGSPEVDAMTPRTVYACGSSDYDRRPGTFKQSATCRPSQ